ncbi:DUF222 domain-containing protein [Microbacterium sp. LWS13-1.2]|uniref:HNH endonuclease n=1 Tax=Microbacterium sp. LWS13-1.2 TaxID=3135264 RepID=A0AAU6SB62_9MICO
MPLPSRTLAQTWALFLDPDGTLPDEDSERMRTSRLGRERNSLSPVHGNVTADVAAARQRLLDAQLSSRVQDRAPRFVDVEPSGAGGSAAGEHVRDPRTADQNRHDAFAGLLAAAAASADSPTLSGAPPTLVVTVAADQLERADGVAFVDGPDGEMPVSATFARHIGCHGTIHRVVLGANGRIKALAVTDRVFTHWQRKAIAARHGGCVIPGCRVRAAWCEIHHVVEYARGGPTPTASPMCGHRRGWINEDGGDPPTGCSTTTCE